VEPNAACNSGPTRSGIALSGQGYNLHRVDASATASAATCGTRTGSIPPRYWCYPQSPTLAQQTKTAPVIVAAVVPGTAAPKTLRISSQKARLPPHPTWALQTTKAPSGRRKQFWRIEIDFGQESSSTKCKFGEHYHVYAWGICARKSC